MANKKLFLDTYILLDELFEDRVFSKATAKKIDSFIKDFYKTDLFEVYEIKNKDILEAINMLEENKKLILKICNNIFALKTPTQAQ